VLFGRLVATGRPSAMAVGYVIGGVLMLAAGLTEVFLGVDAEQKSLEDIATPLSATGDGGSSGAVAGAAEVATGGSPRARPGPRGPHPVPRRRTGRQIWAPMPQASVYPRTNPYLAREVDALVAALDSAGPQTSLQLSRTAGARYWGPGRFRTAVRSGLASGRIRRVGRDRYAVGVRATAAS
jgi:hypothetical protein